MYRNYISFFPYFWNILFFNDSSNIIVKGIVTDSLQFFIILIEILSHPRDLLESSDFIIDSIDSILLFVTRKEFILVLVLYKKEVTHYCFFIGVHIETKKLLNRFAFSQ